MEQSGKSQKRLDKRGWEGYNATIPRMLEERTDGTMKKLRTNMMMLGMCMGSMCMCRCANFHKMLSRSSIPARSRRCFLRGAIGFLLFL